MIGDKHPNWRGGWEYYYGPNWEEQRDKARKRDNHTCQVCGLSKADIGRNPDVHHIIPFREFAYVEAENDFYLQANHLSNLITLCSSCHKKADWGLLTF
jgi:5-methylcytosine-specific restriction endonuclease McrA